MRLIFTALAFSLAMTACADEQPRSLEIRSRPIPFANGEDSGSTIGKLVHRGTLRLTSPDGDFGGISGLIVSSDGTHFLAITDSSHWLTGELTYRGKTLSGVTGTTMAPLLDLDGKPMSGKQGDAEGLTGSLDGDVYISFEGRHRIWRYPYGTNGLAAKPVAVSTPADLAHAPGNGGLEAISRLGETQLLAITEHDYDDAGNVKAWLLNLKNDTSQPLTLHRRVPFDITDARSLANGDLLTLERRFSPTGGIGFELRRFPADSIKPKSVLQGEVIAEAGMNFNIDNMEGLSIRKGPNGETFVYLVSDDNFNSPLQQTLLMLFELRD